MFGIILTLRLLVIADHKENYELAKTKKESVDNQVQSLNDTKVIVDDKEYMVFHKPIFTMVDGELCETKSSLRCY